MDLQKVHLKRCITADQYDLIYGFSVKVTRFFSFSITVTISHTIGRLKHYVRCQQQLFFLALTCTFNNMPNYMMRSNNRGGLSKSRTIYMAIRIRDALLKKITYKYSIAK